MHLILKLIIIIAIIVTSIMTMLYINSQMNASFKDDVTRTVIDEFDKESCTYENVFWNETSNRCEPILKICNEIM